MKSWELLRELFAQACIKNIATALRVSLSLIYKWTEPADGTGSGARNPLDLVVLLMQLTNARRIAQWVAEKADGRFVPNDPAPPVARELLPKVCEVEQKFLATQQALMAAAAKGHIPPAEMAVIQKHWEAQKSVMESFVQTGLKKACRFVALCWALGSSLTAEAAVVLA